MSDRYHYFSHIEDLSSGTLLLTDPFVKDESRALLCRYALHRQTAELLAPDPRTSGLASWHRLLPLDRGIPQRTDAVLTLADAASPFTDRVARLLWGEYDARLPYEIAFPMAHACGWSAAKVDGEEHQLGAFLKHPTSEGMACFTESCPESVSAADFGPWGNPYRLEGLKLIGLEIMHRFADVMPTLVVADPNGELAAGLLLASESARAFSPKRVPYRIILLQKEPFAGLCLRFEGVTNADLPNTPKFPIVEAMASWLIAGINDHLGTAIVLEEMETDPFGAALETLTKTGFVDDEDTVILLQAPPPS